MCSVNCDREPIWRFARNLLTYFAGTLIAGILVGLALSASACTWNPHVRCFSVYRDTLHPSLGSIGEIILSAHAVYVGSKLEWLNEGSLLRHDLQAASRVYHSTTSYSQASWAFGKTRPYVRYDYQNVPSTEPIFGDLPGSLGGSLAGSLARWGPSIGVNRRISDYVALKLQYGRLSQRYVPTANGFTAQLALAF